MKGEMPGISLYNHNLIQAHAKVMKITYSNLQIYIYMYESESNLSIWKCFL